MRLTDLLLSSILLGVACGYEVEIARKESLRHRLIKAGKWNAFLAITRHNVSGVHLAKTLTQTITGDFVTRVSVGTPPQYFTVVMSLSTPWLWVPDKSLNDNSKDNCPSYCKKTVFCTNLCETSCCTPSQKGGLTTFDSSRSSTYARQSGNWLFGVDFNGFGKDEDEVFNVAGFVGSDT
ncbi:aspartic protease 2B, partial [Aphelenchoides avenae]